MCSILGNKLSNLQEITGLGEDDIENSFSMSLDAFKYGYGKCRSIRMAVAGFQTYIMEYMISCQGIDTSRTWKDVDKAAAALFFEMYKEWNERMKTPYPWGRPERKKPPFPNIVYGERYNVWCLDDLPPALLWEIVQGMDGVAGRIDDVCKGDACVRFTLHRGEAAISFAVWGKSRPVCENDEERLYFQNAWFAIPKSFLRIENGEDEESGALAIEFVKKLQKRCPRTAFEYYSGFPDYMVFEDRIQKLNFVSGFRDPVEAASGSASSALASEAENLKDNSEGGNPGDPPPSFLETDMLMLVTSLSERGLDKVMRHYDKVNRQDYRGRKKLILYAPYYKDPESISYLQNELGVRIIQDMAELSLEMK